MATGRSRSWNGLTPVPRDERGFGVNWVDNLSWAADGRTLAYENVYNVRLLDTLAAGRSLKLDSVKGKTAAHMAAASGKRVTLTCATLRGNSGPGYYGNAMLTPDGNLVVATGGFGPGKSAIANIPRARWQGGTLTYPCSAGSRRILRTSLQPIRYGKLTGAARWIYWAGAGGRSLIVVARFGFGGRGLVGVLRDGRFTPLPGTARIPVAPDPPETPVAW